MRTRELEFFERWGAGREPAPSRVVRLLETPKYLVDTRPAQKTDLQNLPHIFVDGRATHDIQGFTSTEKLRTWAHGTPYAAEVDARLRWADAARAFKGSSDLETIKSRALRRMQFVRDAIEHLRSTREKHSSLIEAIGAAVEGPSPLETPLLNSFILFANPRESGNWVPVVFPIPDLSWFAFNDTASSVFVTGVHVITRNTWFGGTWFWCVGFFGTFDLAPAGFDNVASAAF